MHKIIPYPLVGAVQYAEQSCAAANQRDGRRHLPVHGDEVGLADAGRVGPHALVLKLRHDAHEIVVAGGVEVMVQQRQFVVILVRWRVCEVVVGQVRASVYALNDSRSKPQSAVQRTQCRQIRGELLQVLV